VRRRTASAILCENTAVYLLPFASMSHVTVFGHWQTALGSFASHEMHDVARNRSHNLVLGFGSETLLFVIMTSTNRCAI
jgi:hypothetical protein